MITIRPTCAQDISEICALERQQYGADGYPSAFFYQALAQWQNWFWCAELNQQTVGYLLAAPGTQCGEIWLMSLLVSPTARGFGIGKHLVTTFTNQCSTDSSVKTAYLTVAPSNQTALSLYLSLGFTNTTRISACLGPGEDRFLLTWKSK